MASFFGKITRAAKSISKQLDESGMLDKLKSATSDSSATAQDASAAAADSAAASADAGDWNAQQWDEALRRGAVDLRDLLSIHDVTEITGLPIDRRSLHVDEEWFGIGFTAVGHHHNFELRAFHGHVDGYPPDPDGIWDFLTDAITDRTPVDMGDEAFCDEFGQVYVRTRGQVLHTVVSVQDGGYPIADVSEQLLRRALGRI